MLSFPSMPPPLSRVFSPSFENCFRKIFLLLREPPRRVLHSSDGFNLEPPSIRALKKTSTRNVSFPRAYVSIATTFQTRRSPFSPKRARADKSTPPE